MQKPTQHNELYDVYYDVSVTLFDRIREYMDERGDDLAALKRVREHVVQTVAAMENVTPSSVYRDLADVRA